MVAHSDYIIIERMLVCRKISYAMMTLLRLSLCMSLLPLLRRKIIRREEGSPSPRDHSLIHHQKK
jgi:hypothetical protein